MGRDVLYDILCVVRDGLYRSLIDFADVRLNILRAGGVVGLGRGWGSGFWLGTGFWGGKGVRGGPLKSQKNLASNFLTGPIQNIAISSTFWSFVGSPPHFGKS